MKIRSDFVTNSSSSSFVAYGILSKELVSFLKEVVGDYSAACPWQPAEMTWDWDTVNITTEMYDAAESECFLADREDGKRHLSRHEKDKRAASKADVLMKAIQRCVDEVRITEEQKKQIQQLVEQAVAEGRVVCNTYADETDGWVLFNFSRDDFLNASCIKKDRNGRVVGFDDRGGEPRTWRFTCTSVTGGLFRWCHNTEEIVVEGGSVEAEAFAGCDSLKRLDMSAMKEHDAVASMCEDCVSLETVRLPIYVGRIEECAFAGCERLRDIQIPSSVFYIHPTAFEGCDALPEETRRVIASLTSEKSLDECEAETLHYIQTHGMANFGVEDGYYRSRLGRMKRLLETWWAVYGPELDWPEILLGDATYGVYAEKGVEIVPPRPQWKMLTTIGKKMRYMIVDTENISNIMMFEKKYILNQTAGASQNTRLDKVIDLKKQGSGIQILTKAHFEKLVAADAFAETDPKAPALQKPKVGKVEQRREAFEQNDDYQAAMPGLQSATPDRSLYPNYAAKSSSPFSGFSGVTVVHNPAGTDYQLIKVGADKEEKDWPQYVRRVYELVSHDYTLADTARGMIRLFRVDKEVFSMGHDRECELRAGYMHRAYMMSALRSFAWTLAAYCEAEGKTPETVDLAMLCRITEYIKERQWLNYDGNSYCKGLCGGSDLHTFYLPDAVTQADRKKFLPTPEEVARDNEIKKKFPNYNPIYGEVHSLEALREDLTYLYPAIKTLYEHLAEERDTTCELVGAEADVVYAWIALAVAAENPFFTEDGPMRCFFTWPGESDNAASHTTEKKETMPKKTASPRKVSEKPVGVEEKAKEKTAETDDAPTESPEQKRAAAALAATALRETLAQEARQLREQMEALYEQKRQEIKAAEAAAAEQKRREEAEAAERRRQEAEREAERKRQQAAAEAERKRREEEELAAQKRREAAARELELARRKTQLQAQRDALRKERDAIKGLFAKARKAKLEPQIAEIEAELASLEEELNTLRAMDS